MHTEVFLISEGEFDAAEIDKELISARLKQDVLEHSGKVHLFIADSVYLQLPVYDCNLTDCVSLV